MLVLLSPFCSFRLEDVLMEESKLFLVFEFLNMDLKKYVDSLESGKYLDKKLIKSYVHQVRYGQIYGLIVKDNRFFVNDFSQYYLYMSPVFLYKFKLVYYQYPFILFIFLS